MSVCDAPKHVSQLTNPAPLVEDGDSSANEIPYKDAAENGVDAPDDVSAADNDDDDDEGDAEPDEWVISKRTGTIVTDPEQILGREHLEARLERRWDSAFRSEVARLRGRRGPHLGTGREPVRPLTQ